MFSSNDRLHVPKSSNKIKDFRIKLDQVRHSKLATIIHFQRLPTTLLTALRITYQVGITHALTSLLPTEVKAIMILIIINTICNNL